MGFLSESQPQAFKEFFYHITERQSIFKSQNRNARWSYDRDREEAGTGAEALVVETQKHLISGTECCKMRKILWILLRFVGILWSWNEIKWLAAAQSTVKVGSVFHLQCFTESPSVLSWRSSVLLVFFKANYKGKREEEKLDLDKKVPKQQQRVLAALVTLFVQVKEML